MSGPLDGASLSSPVAVVGYGLVAPGCNSGEDFWRVLQQENNQFADPELFDANALHEPETTSAERLRTKRGGHVRSFRPHPILAAEIEQGRWQSGDTEVLWLRHCLLQAVDGFHRTSSERAGCYLSAWPGGTIAFENDVLRTAAGRELGEAAALLLDRRFGRVASDAPLLMPPGILSRAVSGILDPDPDLLTLSGACASSLYGIDLAIQALYAGGCDVAFSAAVNVVGRNTALTADKFGGGSRRGELRAFDASADGTVFADGAAVLALKTWEKAVTDGDRILGVLTRPGLGSDGRGKGIAAPHPAGMRRMIERGWQEGGLTGRGPDWVIAHGTGTRAGDTAELQALSDVSHSPGLVCSSNKPLIGHTAWTSGLLSVIHGLLALEHDLIPAQQYFTTLNPAVENPSAIDVPLTARPWPSRQDEPRTVGISAFGIGGIGGHIVLRDSMPRNAAVQEPRQACAEDPLVLVGYSACLPGLSPQEATRWLRTGQSPPGTSFGPGQPDLPFTATRLSPGITRVIDRSHLLALAVASDLVQEHGELWENLRSTTGVICAQSGPTRSLRDTMVRAGAAELEKDFAGHPQQHRLDSWLEAVRKRQPITEESFAGSTPSVAANRITNRWDIHGPSITIDTGPSSSRDALRIARAYLADGRLDLALLLATNEDSGPDAQRYTSSDAPLAEGAFLLALTTRSRARQHGWTEWGNLDGEGTGGPRPDLGEHYYFGAEEAARTLSRMLTAPGNDRAKPDAEGPDAVLRWSLIQRCAGRVQPPPETCDAQQAPTDDVRLPSRGIVLVGQAELARRLSPAARRQGALLVSSDPVTEAEHALVIDGDITEETLAALTPLISEQRPHVQVIATNDGPIHEAAGLDAAQRLLRLTALAAKLTHERIVRESGSLTALILDPQPSGLPHPHTGLFTGFLRSAATETSTGRVLALVTDAPWKRAFATMEAESGAHGVKPVVYHRAGSRFEEEMAHRPLPHPTPRDLVQALSERPTIVLAGGGRGITPVLIREIARHSHPILWILGRTDPECPPHILEAEERQRSALRAEYIRDSARAGSRPLNGAQQFDALWNARELNRNLRSLRTLCGEDSVHYLKCNLADPAAVKESAQQILSASARVDLLLHTARYQQAARIPNKSPAAFHLGLAAKVSAYGNLRAAFEQSPPRRWINFGSTLSALGFPGEGDYCAANEFLAAAARREESGSGTLHRTVGWGLWEESGVASGATTRQGLAENGIDSGMSDAEGSAAFLAEICADFNDPAPFYATAKQVERSSSTAAPGLPTASPTTLDLLGDPSASSEGQAAWRWSPDLHHDRYLREHTFNGRPMLPGAVFCGMAAEAAERLLPGTTAHELLDISFDKFVFVDLDKRAQATAKYTLIAEVPPDQARDTRRRYVDVTLVSGSEEAQDPGGAHVHARARVVTRSQQPTPPSTTRASHNQPSYLDGARFMTGGLLHLSGVFQNMTAAQHSAGTVTALWQPPAWLPDRIGHGRTPMLLLDALIRVATLPPDPAEGTGLHIPRAIEGIDLHYKGSDWQLGREESVITLQRRRAPKGRFEHEATTATGQVLLRLNGPTFEPASLPGRTPPSAPAPRKPRRPASLEPAEDGPVVYRHRRTMQFGDVSAARSVYYTRPFHWMGECRELWAMAEFPAYLTGVATGTTLMLTRSATCEYLQPIWFGDEIVVELRVPWVRMHYMAADFRVYRDANDGPQLAATGKQMWANARPADFGSSADPAPWPREVIDAVAARGTDITRAWVENR
ncbi:beta-ketoacyl synthase N-terminal-like domain-containing protein [Streptomyces bacillaris]|uniref:beta-ketoacyl synthase N-terminal-like domain-containing protein n=1 Tax=Streptomyces bacillaris TaxID=68179 RepID=UPI003460B459